MKKKIFGLSFLFLFVLFFGNFYAHTAIAEEVVPEEIVETPAPATLSLITITHPADKTEYVVGDALDITSLEVTGTYSDDSSNIENVTEEDISGFDSAAPAVGQVLTIIVGEQTTTYTVNINAPEEIPDGDTYFQIEGNIVLKNGCVVEDKDGVEHIFPETSGPEYVAICALEEAIETGLVENMEFADFGFGLFVNSVNDTTEENTYWKLNINDVGASVGASQLEVGAGDTVSLVLTAFDPTTFEETSLDASVTLTIETLNSEFNNISLPDRCLVADGAGATHEFPEESSPSDYLAICALASAKDAGKISDFKLNDSDFGLYVQSVNNEEPGDTEYWALWLNGEFANCGIICLPMVKGDVLSLVLSDWMANTESTNIKIRVVGLTATPDEEEDEEGSGGGEEEPGAPSFSVPNAVAYLKSAQSSDGSFADSALYTDWAAIAYGAGNVSGSPLSSLLEYLSSNNSISSLITDNERRAMALMALGENPYSFHGKNYIDAITEEFDGTQFGDEDLVNDDIFALIPLFSAGYEEDDETVVKTIDFILEKQSGNGSWEGSVDVTAAAVQALAPFDSVDGVEEALGSAETYLKNTQASDGGWQNVSSTSWAMQAESALGGAWIKNGKGGMDYLATQQSNAENTGALLSASESSENVIWATSYAIPAGLGKPWSEIMESFSKPKNEDGDSNKNSEKEEEKEAETTSLLPVVPPANEIIPVVPNIPPVTKNIVVVPTEKIKNSSDADSEKVEETETSVLTATAANALPEENNPASLPIVLGTASGLILLYGAFKFFI
ncbi:MAG: DUF4430 domain-containing protein [Minisyncoccia bacterium]